jgi:predicted dehydrogenase
VTQPGRPLLEIEPDRVRRVPVSSHARYHAEKYRRPLRKLALFALRDGPMETLRKARSKLVERRVEAAQEILVCAWRDAAGARIGVTRDLGGAPRFHPELVFDAPDDASPDDVRLPDDVTDLLESYLPVPECPLAPAVATAFLAANPELSRVAEGPPPTRRKTPPAPARTGEPAAGRVFLLGYGGYVREQVLPLFRGDVAGAVDHKSELLRQHSPSHFPVYRDLDDLLPAIAAAERPLVIVATYHSDHAASALAVLDANPDARVFVEKPATVTVDDARALAERRAAGAWIDVGFNRRYAAMTADLVDAAARLPRPLVFSALVKELKLPPTHWYRWPNQGTRVTGNLCHWIDLAHHLVRRPCVAVEAMGDGVADATVSAILRFDDGSIATLVGTDAGDDLGGVMEHLELRGGGSTLVVDDYRRLVRTEDGQRRVRRARREKGHGRMYRALRRRWLDGAEPLYPAGDLVAVAESTAAIVAGSHTHGHAHPGGGE